MRKINIKLYKHPEENMFQYFIRFCKNIILQIKKQGWNLQDCCKR